MKTLALGTMLALGAAAACGGGAEEAGDAEEAAPEPQAQESPTVAEEEPEPTFEAPTVDLADGEELVLVAGWAGDPSDRLGGYAVEGEEITSPGPTIRVREGDTVTITFENAHFWEDGRPFGEPHNITIVRDKDESVWEMQPLWDANVGGYRTAGLKPGERESVTFTADTAGTFYYVCAYADHIDHGMWGSFVVEA